MTTKTFQTIKSMNKKQIEEFSKNGGRVNQILETNRRAEGDVYVCLVIVTE